MVRLWTYWNGGYVRLTLKPEHTEWNPLTLYHYSKTDEGWSSLAEEYWIDDGYVYSRCTSDGRDCDGRLTRQSTFLCKLSQIATTFPYQDLDKSMPWELRVQALGNEGVMLPTWKEASYSQRDYTAEAVGY